MSTNPSVAVLIPCYNEEEHIPGLLENVLSLTYPNLELIACDDASEDRTWDLLCRNQSKIKLLRNEVNLGPAATRNRLFNSAKSEYIHFQDADDLIHPRFTEFMLPWLQEGAYEVVLCQVHNFYNDDPFDIRDGFYVRPAYPNEHPYVHAIDVAGHAINSLYKKATLTRVGGFDETLMYAEDYDLHLRLGELGARMAVVGQSLVKHRCRPKPRTFTMEDLMEKAFQLLRDSAERMKGSRVFEDDLFRRHLSTKFWHMARLLSESNKPGSAYEAFAYSRELYRQDCPMGSPFYKMTYRIFGFRFAEYLRMKKRLLS